MRLFLVRVGDGDDEPVGAFARVFLRDPRRYAVVDDRAAFTAWVARRHPDWLASHGDGVAVIREAEQHVLKCCASRGGWITQFRDIGPVEPVPGVVVRSDGVVDFVTVQEGASLVESWQSTLHADDANRLLEAARAGRVRA